MRRNLRNYTTARKLRSSGWSYSEISTHLKVAKSTLSGWLYDVVLSLEQRQKLRQKWELGLKKARIRAAVVHRLETDKRFSQASVHAQLVLTTLGKFIKHPSLQKLALAMLYLGEGTKKKSLVCLANSNPNICRMFITILRQAYPSDEAKFRCHLHLRVDQHSQSEIAFWSKQLHIPRRQFIKTQFDRRSTGKPTLAGYHGVCAIYYYDAAVQKDILMLGQAFQNQILMGN